MRCKCSMYGCRAATYNKYGYLLNFHRFPKDPRRNKIWKEICKNPRIMHKNNKNLWLCSLHFERSCYVNEYLKPDAVPTLKLPDFRIFSAETQKRDETDSNDILLYTDEDSGSANPSQEESARYLATKSHYKPYESSTFDEEDDCESVNFSSSEGEQPDDAEADDCGRESPQPSSSDVVKDEHDASSLVVLTHNTPASRVNPSPNLVEPVYQSLPKITRVSSIAETQTVRPSFSRTAPISAVIDKVVEDNFEEAQHDDCSTFAAHVNMRMRRFDPTQKVIAQKLISDIMFMADTMQLNLASAVVNPQHQAAQFAKAVHDAQVAHAAQLAHAAQVVHASQGEPVPQATNNGFPNQAVGGSYSAYVLDSDEDSGPLNKKMK